MDTEKKYEKETVDVDELEARDLDLNPDFFINNAILKAQSCLVKENTKMGFMQFRLLVNHAVSCCKAAKKLRINFEEDLEEEIKKIKTKDAEMRELDIANLKLEIIMTDLFSNKIKTDPLKDKS